MATLNVSFLLQGASFIKKNSATFQADCSTLATQAGVCPAVAAQLQAASKAVKGACNTGLSEAGWRPLAEVIGMVSPKSVKLMDNSLLNKQAVLETFIKTGVYPSSRTNGAGGSRAERDITKAQALVEKGVWSLASGPDGNIFRKAQAELSEILRTFEPVAKPAPAVKPARKSRAKKQA